MEQGWGPQRSAFANRPPDLCRTGLPAGVNRSAPNPVDFGVAGGPGEVPCALVLILGGKLPIKPDTSNQLLAIARDPSVTSLLCAAKAARTSSFSFWGTPTKSRVRPSSAATSSNSSEVTWNWR